MTEKFFIASCPRTDGIPGHDVTGGMVFSRYTCALCGKTTHIAHSVPPPKHTRDKCMWCGQEMSVIWEQEDKKCRKKVFQ